MTIPVTIFLGSSKVLESMKKLQQGWNVRKPVFLFSPHLIGRPMDTKKQQKKPMFSIQQMEDAPQH